MGQPFQFSIRFLLVAIAAVAAGVAAIRAEPTLKSSLAIDCLTLLFATSAFVGVARTTCKVRTFWIGMAVALSAALVMAALSMWQIVMLIRAGSVQSGVVGQFLWPLWCVAPVNGLFAVFLDWLFSPRRPPDVDGRGVVTNRPTTP